MTREAGIHLPRLEVCPWWGGSERKPRRQASGRYAEKDEMEEGEGRVAAAEGPHQ